jgi:hypothetical protein
MNETIQKDVVRKDIEGDLKKELEINDADIATELREQSTKFFFYGTLWARALRAERQQKLIVESLEASLSKEFRELMLRTEPGTRVTEKMLKEYISGAPLYQEAQQKLINAGYSADLFNVAKTAFESRGRMLLELSRQTGENKFYDREFLNMKDEFERREEKKAKGRSKKAESKGIVE